MIRRLHNFLKRVIQHLPAVKTTVKNGTKNQTLFKVFNLLQPFPRKFLKMQVTPKS